MGNYLTKGTVFADGGPCNAALLNAHVDEAILKPTAISSQTLKDPAALSDELLINDGGALKKVTLQQLHNLVLYPGCVVQTVYSEYTANTNLTATIPLDDTIPQSSEGTEILNVSITPRFATSVILCYFHGQWAANANVAVIAALFRDSVVSAIAATIGGLGDLTSNNRDTAHLVYQDSPATISAVAYKIRIGPSTASTVRMNGQPAARNLGGSSRATLVLQEIKV